MPFRYCPRCATELEQSELAERLRPRCPGCGFIHYRNPTTGVAVVVMREGQLLLVQRRGSYDGHWCIPCGHVEWDEPIGDCARREMKEETGFDVELGPVVDVHSNFHDRQHQTVGIWFAGAVTGGELRAGSDARQARFFALDALPQPMAFPTDLAVCAKLERMLQSTRPATGAACDELTALRWWFEHHRSSSEAEVAEKRNRKTGRQEDL